MQLTRITTPYGKYFDIDKDGNVVRASNGLDLTEAKESEKKNWRIIGMTSTHPFASLNVQPLKESDLLYKNGRPKYKIVDIDHGTPRVHGNSKWYGIKDIFTVTA